MSSMTATSTDEREMLRQAARDIFATALAECSVESALARKMWIVGTELRFQNEDGVEEVFDLATYDRVRIIATGKAAAPMLQALLSPLREILQHLPACDVAGILATPEAELIAATLPPEIRCYTGSHPLPNAASLEAARAARRMLAALPRDAENAERSLVIFLISGGASAMLEEPLETAITLEETVEFHHALIHCGAPIAEINCVRKHFSAVKGGRLAMAAPRGSRMLAFFVSDVPTLQLASLGSGPVLPDVTTVEQCFEVIDHYALMGSFPVSVRRFFQQRFLPETPKPGAFAMSTFKLLDGHDLVEAARKRALQLGFRVGIDNTCDEWEYMAAARYLLERLQGLRVPMATNVEMPKPFSTIRGLLLPNSRLLQTNSPQEGLPEPAYVCLLSGGEVSVRVEPPAGQGGRNQQFALYAATQMKTTPSLEAEEEQEPPIVVFSAGSDGVDGNSPAAGAIADSVTLARAEEMGLHAEQALAQFDAFPVFNALGDTVMIGPTGNNLRDLRILLTAAKPAPVVVEVPAMSKPARTRRPRMKILK